MTRANRRRRRAVKRAPAWSWLWCLPTLLQREMATEVRLSPLLAGRDTSLALAFGVCLRVCVGWENYVMVDGKRER